MKKRLAAAGLLATLTLGVAACGDDNTESGDTGMSEMEMDSEGEKAQYSFGSPGDPAKASRTVEVRMLDSLQFEPSSIEVMPGETVTFKVTNTGAQTHEFIIGDQQFQDEHEKEMAEMSGGKSFRMADEPYGVNTEPGQTEEVTWTFPNEAGEAIFFACHEPGHFNTMKGEFKVTTMDMTGTTMPGQTATTMNMP